MSVLGEAGGFGVQVGEWPFYDPERTRNLSPAVLIKAPHYGFQGVTPSEARGLAALLVMAADEAERGKPPQAVPARAVLGPFTVDYAYTPNPYEDFVVNGLQIPFGAHSLTTFSATEAVAYDKYGRPIASNMLGVNVPGDPGVGGAG